VAVQENGLALAFQWLMCSRIWRLIHKPPKSEVE
jgi:hypothetical protein